MNLAALLPAGFMAIVTVVIWSRWRQAQRAQYIQHFHFPVGLFAKLQRRRPELSQKDCQLVAQGLRQFFLAYLKSGKRHVAMPSQVADDLWHEFILYTRQYEIFCRQAFGGFLHHTPAIALKPAQRADNAGLRRVWWHCCKEENLDPRKATRLPLLFALDAKFKIADGYFYVPDCNNPRRESGGGASPYCGGEFADASVDGSTDGFGDSSTDGASDGGGGDGCGGGGCGGD